MPIEWRKAPAFAEFAEALSVRTDEIMAASMQEERWMVFYTQGDTELIWSALLERGVDGILFQSRQAVSHPGMWEEIVKKMEEGA